jgi:hypothetical protein
MILRIVEMITQAQGENKEKGLFVKIPVLKVFLLSSFTLGFYDYFWFYKQWKTIRKTKKNYINPVVAAIFKIITVFFLPKIIQKAARQKSYYVVVVPILYILGHSFITWIISNLEASAVLFVFFVQVIIRALAVSIMQRTINNSLSFESEEINIELSDVACIIIFFMLLGMKTCDTIPVNTELSYGKYSKNWQKYILDGELIVDTPFSISRDDTFDNSQEISSENQIVYFSGSSQNGAISISYVYIEHNNGYFVNWDVLITEKAEALGIDKNKIKIEYKIYGNKTGRLLTWVNAENVYVYDLIIFDINKKWEFVVTCKNSNNNIKIANKIIGSININ